MEWWPPAPQWCTELRWQERWPRRFSAFSRTGSHIFSEFPDLTRNAQRPQPATACMDLSLRFESIDSERLNNWFNNWFNNWYNMIQLYNWFNRLFQILCPSHLCQMSLTSSQRFKARLWRISKNSLLPIENNVKHDMAENWDWDATRLVFWLKSLLTLIHVEAISTVEDSAHAHFRKLETWSCNFEMSSRLPRRWKVLLWFTWSSCQDLKKANCHL